MNSPTKDLLQFAKVRGLPVVLYQSGQRGPITVDLKRADVYLTQPRYDWSIAQDRIKLFAEGFEGHHSPAAKAKRLAAKQAGEAPAPVGGSPAPEAGQEAEG